MTGNKRRDPFRSDDVHGQDCGHVLRFCRFGGRFHWQLSLERQCAPGDKRGCELHHLHSTDAPQPIGPGGTTTNSTITVPGSPRIQDLDVSVTLNHANGQIDAHLRSPADNDNGLFTTIGSKSSVGRIR